MEALAAALIIIFCTPFGWMGLLILAVGISMIYEVKEGK